MEREGELGPAARVTPKYEAPRLVELGLLGELTLASGHCTEKLSGHSDGLHFSSQNIVCTSH